MKALGSIEFEFWKPSEITSFYSWIIHLNFDYKVIRLFGMTLKYRR